MMLEEFGIDEHGSCVGSLFPIKKSPPIETEPLVDQDEKERSYFQEDGFFCKHSKFDFVQEIARAGNHELNCILRICIELMDLGCHKNRIPGGPVEHTMRKIVSDWNAMGDKCERLQQFVKERNDAKIREDKRRVKRRKREKDNKLSQIYNSRSEEKKTYDEDVESEDRSKYLSHGGYASPLLLAIKVSPSVLYQDMKNIRRALIWCLMCLSEDIQRLVRCGKFYSETYKCRLRYVPIRQDGLDEFVHLIDPLKNAFYTCQMSAANFVVSIRSMVEKKGVDHFVSVILSVSRNLETFRIAKAHLMGIQDAGKGKKKEIEEEGKE